MTSRAVSSAAFDFPAAGFRLSSANGHHRRRSGCPRWAPESEVTCELSKRPPSEGVTFMLARSGDRNETHQTPLVLHAVQQRPAASALVRATLAWGRSLG
jgi:hypothetical protein